MIRELRLGNIKPSGDLPPGAYCDPGPCGLLRYHS